MKKCNLLNSLILAALAVPGVAMAADTLPITANVGLVTDYLYRGISQTGAKPALQGGFDYAHASGFYAGLWGSNVSWVGPSLGASSSSLELDTYAGFKGGFAGDFSYDVGFLRYNYPGVYPSPIATGFAKADTNEIYGALGWKWVTLKYSHSLGDTFGLADASGTSYVELNASYTLADAGVTLGAHYGKQTYKGKYEADLSAVGYAAGAKATYSDYKLSASKDFSGYVVGLAYSSTNAEKGVGQYYNVLQADGSRIDLGKGTAVLSVSHAL
ncbi:MAG: TorF family putative porin [Pseudomonadota bacterium]